MTIGSSKSPIIFSIGGLAAFTIFASCLLISFPIYSSLQVYFQEGHRFKSSTQDIAVSNANITSLDENVEKKAVESSVEKDLDSKPVSVNRTKVWEINKISPPSLSNETAEIVIEVYNGKGNSTELYSDEEKEVGVLDNSVSPDKTEAELVKNDWKNSSLATHDNEIAISSGKSEPGSCNLYTGKWIYDTVGPLYTNNTCPIITQMQNCQGNGRPDKEYENYRWKPDQCNLPRFNPRKFLEMMRGKTIAFVGDSVSRNQYESLICILWQEEAPKNRGNKRMQRWYFRSTSTMIVRIWSSWLVHQTPEPFHFAPKGIPKLFLDVPDETFMEHLPSFDVLILSSGHWFAKQSVYILNNTIVGGQLWWPKTAPKMQVNNVQAFATSVETSVSAIAKHPNFTGLAIVRSYSPDHYEGGAWNTGGSCTGKVKPLYEVVRNGFTDVMVEKQRSGFRRAVEKEGDGGKKVRFMDITEGFGYRADGHPGPFRSLDPNKVTKRGPDGKPPPQDCLHWCMPGPVDTWNEIMMELIRREFEQVLNK